MGVLNTIKAEIPSWGTFPKNTIYPDFYKRVGYPQNITIPNNKFIVFEHDVRLDIEPRNDGGQLKNPIPYYGFIADLKTNPVEGKIGLDSGQSTITLTYWNREKHGGLVGDSYWCNIANGDDYTQWYSSSLISIAANQRVLALDLEHHQWNTWNSNHWNKMAQIMSEVKAVRPDVLIGGWARHDATIGPFYDPNNGGVENSAGFDFYADMYDNGPGNNISGFYQTGMTAAFPFAYMKGRQTAQLMYNLMHTVELSQLYNPTVKQIPTAWIEIEKIADYENDDQDTVLQHNRTDKVIKADEKLHTPPDIVFAMSILGLTVWNGVYWFGTGAAYTDNISYADDIGIQPDGNQDSIYSETVRGKRLKVYYRWQYKGFVNYNVIANYMCSLEPYKSIIENTFTSWLMPEYKRSTELSWQTGKKIRPSWCYANKAPIIRLKYSQDGTKCMFIAFNPRAGIKVETWNFRLPNSTWESSIKLTGGWLEMGYINIVNV